MGSRHPDDCSADQLSRPGGGNPALLISCYSTWYSGGASVNHDSPHERAHSVCVHFWVCVFNLARARKAFYPSFLCSATCLLCLPTLCMQLREGGPVVLPKCTHLRLLGKNPMLTSTLKAGPASCFLSNLTLIREWPGSDLNRTRT